MKCIRIVNSIFASCTYILYRTDAHDAIIIDCGDPEPILGYLRNHGLVLSAIFLTHTHFDHIYGLMEVVKYYPLVKIYTTDKGVLGLKYPKYNISLFYENVVDFSFESDNIETIVDGVVIVISQIEIQAIASPGHDWSCLSYIINGMLFTGDSYIPNKRVIASFPKSDRKLAEKSESMLVLLESEGFRVMPGHIINKNENIFTT